MHLLFQTQFNKERNAKGRTAMRYLGSKSEAVLTGHHNTLESDVVRSVAIGNGSCASIEDSVCHRSTETFRPWRNYARSFNRRLSFQATTTER